MSGVITTAKMPQDTYIISVVALPEGYTVSNNADATLDASMKTTVVLTDDKSLTFEFGFESKGSLKIMSLNSSGTAVPGMKVAITTLEGTPVGEHITGADGSVLVNGLDSGWYMVKETNAPNGYAAANPSEQKVEIKAGVQAEVSFSHGQVYGIQVTTTCVETNAKIPGAKYEVRKMSGEIVGTYTSNDTGLFFVSLEPGWYTVAPVSITAGYQFTDMTARSVEVKTDAITYLEVAVNQMSSLRIKVINGNTKAALYGVRLQLKNSESIIKEYYTDAEGYVTLDASVLAGDYTIEMISAPDGYILDKIPRNLKTTFGATTEVTWALYTEGGQIQVLVKSADYNMTLDKESGTPLQGAIFEITNPDTYQVVGTMISDAKGIAASSPLPLGRYIVTMTSSPAYYAVNNDFKEEVRLKVNNDVVRVETSVKTLNLKTEITMQSNAAIRASNTMRVDITSAKNASDSRLDNFFLHIKVPTDAARISALNTGTWNKAVFYSISYKTNMADYRTLAKNLQSTNAYEYGLSTQSLGLQSGEYVTDVRFEFGTVPSGFAIVQKPCYTQYVLATVGSGYKVISRAELGGQYNTVHLSTTGIDNNNPYSATGAIVIVGGSNAGTYGGTGDSASISGNSGQWSTATALWTTTVS